MRLLLFQLGLSIVFLFSCGKSEKEVAGIYVKQPSVNTIDSLFIYAESLQPTSVYDRKVYKYKQRFYNKKTGQLLFENIQTWWLNGSRIELENLFLDEDTEPIEGVVYTKERLATDVIGSSLLIGGNQITINDDKNVYYKKVSINKRLSQK